ncbi:hypothetical protein NM688_g3612 [Phlebia brevispora]|uniref:Uncharacterized protein n=1 Tax=Phlebia brevispora TaxID=194682 RepID=A0ACC1T524_9APHY|nr:hypothetical protein NM688_g3612 [Phlebia brevispora]
MLIDKISAQQRFGLARSQAPGQQNGAPGLEDGLREAQDLASKAEGVQGSVRQAAVWGTNVSAPRLTTRSTHNFGPPTMQLANHPLRVRVWTNALLSAKL